MNWALVGSIYGRSSLKIAHFVPNLLTNMAATGNSCFWLADFLAHLDKGHVSFCHHLASVCPFVRPSYVVNFNLLLRKHWANCNQTLVEWYLYGPLPKLCPLIPTSNQDGHQAKNRKRGDEILIVHCCYSISQNEFKF